MADISAVHYKPILDGLRRKDHVVFFLNMEGHHPNDSVGYTLVNEIINDEGMTQFSSTGKQDLGTVISHEDEGSHVWYHGIVNHGIRQGWRMDDEDEFLEDPDCCYAAMVKALNEIWEKFGDDVVRPIRTCWPASGKQRQIGEQKGDLKRGMAALCAADSLMPLEVYVYA